MLTNENYFSTENQMRYMGVSQFKMFEKCESMALAAVSGNFQPPKTSALLVGSFVDAYFEGSLEHFYSENPEILKRDGSLKAEYQQAERIIERIGRDPMFMRYMSGDKQVIMTGEIAGVPVKIKIDSYHPHRMIVDLKVMKDFAGGYKEGEGRLNWVEYWQYDLQGAVYQEIVRQNTGEQLPFYLAAATKERVTDIDIVHVPQPYLDVALKHFSEYVEKFDALKRGYIKPERCECCDYCKMTKVLTEPKEIGVLDYE